MSVNPHRWVMTVPGEPMEKMDFDPFPAGDGEVIVSIAGCGVCHTDLGYFYDGVRTTHALPLALGHEISGRVVGAGKRADQWMGKSVIIPAVIPCGECDLCRRGKETICRNQAMPGYDIQGGFASHIKVSAQGLCAVDEERLVGAGLQLADLAVVADAITTPYHAVEQSGLGPNSLAIVVGIGGVGGYAAQIANAFGATVVAVDIDATKLDRIAAHGAALTLNSREVKGRDLKAAISEFAEASGLPATEWFIFECSGTAAGQATAYSLLVHGATLGVVGFTMDKVELRLSNLMAYHARALGNWGCPPRSYPDVVEMVVEHKIEVAAFVEHRPLDEINSVFETVHAHETQNRPILIPAA